VASGGRPHHSFHVFCVYPWLGLLGNDRMHDHALDVLDKCRIRWAQVDRVSGGEVIVKSQPLAYEDGRLELAPPRLDVATYAAEGTSGLASLASGDWVSVHWDWVCDRLSDRQVASLSRHTAYHLAVANDRLAGAALRKALD
jgi:hypothetical protein